MMVCAGPCLALGRRKRQSAGSSRMQDSPASVRRAFAFRGDEHSTTKTPAISTAAHPTREPPEAELQCPESAPSGSEVATDRRRTAQAWLSRASAGYCLVGLASEAP